MGHLLRFLAIALGSTRSFRAPLENGSALAEFPEFVRAIGFEPESFIKELR